MRAILVDDELGILENLKLKLKEFCQDIIIVGTASKIKDAVNEINKKKPDVVFLDVEIPPGTGFDILKLVDYKEMQVIFITAHDHYALKAIKNNAFDYLLKPVIITELIETVEKLKENIKNKPNKTSSNDQNANKIEISTANGIVYVDVNRIIRIKADGPYSEIIINKNEKLYVSKTLKYFEDKLGNNIILRVHKSHMVNLNMVRKYEKADGGLIILSNNDRIEVSNTYRDQFLLAMKNNCIS